MLTTGTIYLTTGPLYLTTGPLYLTTGPLYLTTDPFGLIPVILSNYIRRHASVKTVDSNVILMDVVVLLKQSVSCDVVVLLKQSVSCTGLKYNARLQVSFNSLNNNCFAEHIVHSLVVFEEEYRQASWEEKRYRQVFDD